MESAVTPLSALPCLSGEFSLTLSTHTRMLFLFHFFTFVFLLISSLYSLCPVSLLPSLCFLVLSLFLSPPPPSLFLPILSYSSREVRVRLGIEKSCRKIDFLRLFFSIRFRRMSPYFRPMKPLFTLIQQDMALWVTGN